MTRLRVAALLVAGLAVTRASGSRTPERARPAELPRAAPVLAQWIWTERDARLFEQERARRPALVPVVLSATVRPDLTLRRGLSPAVGGEHAGVVVRFEDGVAGALETRPDVDERLNALFTELLAETRAAGVAPSEFELDFDAPVRLLPRWAHAVQRLSRGSLRGFPLWITSIPAHLETDTYASLFRGAVSGHILQLFDTGLPATHANAAWLGSRLAALGLPFRVGVAGFERGRNGVPVTDHRHWARAASTYATLPGYAGTMIFPAGAPYEAVARVSLR
ncbi:MAG TPA: hypothetical protein VMI54_10090 [Polyangiaceae bacterium]|nr:hypothetical protein [Polyangiaceae bacterium]